MVTKSVIFVLVLLMVITAGCGGGVVAVPAPNVFTIKVTDNGAPVSGVGLFIDLPGQGTGTEDRITDSFGKATFSATGNGDYTFTPTKDRYSFDPPSKTVGWTGVFSIDVTFEANEDEIPPPTITTTVTAGGAGVSDVSLAIYIPDMSGHATQTTDSDGTNSFTPNGGNGEYQIIPSHEDYSFDPPSHLVDWDGSQDVNVSFDAYTATQAEADALLGWVIIPALREIEVAKFAVDNCARMCDGRYGNIFYSEDCLWPRTIQDTYPGSNGYLWWNVQPPNDFDMTIELHNFTVSINGIKVTFNGEYYINSGYYASLYQWYNIRITGDVSANITDYSTKYSYRQPQEGHVTISHGGKTSTRQLDLDTTHGSFTYGFYKDLKPCPFSCLWNVPINTNCDTPDHLQVQYCDAKDTRYSVCNEN